MSIIAYILLFVNSFSKTFGIHLPLSLLLEVGVFCRESDKTYAVITNQGECNYSEPLDTEDIEGMTYEACDIEYSVAKINGNIVEAFLYGIGETGKI